MYAAFLLKFEIIDYSVLNKMDHGYKSKIKI